MSQTCFPEVPFNEVIQDKIIKSIFDKISKCSSEKEIKDSINDLLTEKSKLGLISLESLRQTDDLQTKINLLVQCSLSEVDQSIGEEININPSYVVSGITSFICTPPTFDYPNLDINFNFSLRDVFNKILFELIDMLMQAVIQIIQKIVNVLTNLCDGGIEDLTQGYENIKDILNQSFRQSFNSDLNYVNTQLEKIFNTFGFKTDGNVIKSESFPECEDNIDAIKSVNQFLNDLSMMITPNEICLLLEGNPNNLTLNTIKELLDFDYKLLKTRLSDDVIITDFFSKLGKFVPKNVCENIKSKYQDIPQYSSTCDTELSSREFNRSSILRDNGNSEEQIRELLNAERKRYSDRFKSLSKFVANYRNNPDSIFQEMSKNVFCKNGNPGAVTLANFPLLTNTTKTVINSYFTSVRNTHFRESQNIQDLYFDKNTQRRKITRFYSALPEEKRRIGNIRIENGENVDFRRVQALGNPLYYTNNQDYALVVEKYAPDVVYSFTNQISRSIYTYINNHLTRMGRIISNGPGSDLYDDIFDDANVTKVANNYNSIIDTDKLYSLSERMYNDYFISSNAPVYDPYDLNKITEIKIADYFAEEFDLNVDSEEDIDILNKILFTSLDYGENNNVIEIPKPNGDTFRAYRFSNSAGFTTTNANVERILEQFFENADIIHQYSEDVVGDNSYSLADYNSINFIINQPPTIETYTLRQLRVINTENIDNRWLADMNKIIKAGVTDEQPIGILEEFQTSDLVTHQDGLSNFDNKEKSVDSLDLNYVSLYNQTNIIVPQDNSVLKIDEVYSEELSNTIKKLDAQQLEQVNYLLNQNYSITNHELLNKKVLLYQSSSFTNGPFRETDEAVKEEIKNIVNSKNPNVSWQIDTFKKISNLTEEDYYLNLANTLNDLQANEKFKIDLEDKELKNLILILPFEQIIGIKSTKNKCINDYINDPCAISEESNPKEPSLLNKYIVIAQIKLLIKTLCLRQELKDLLSLTKFNPYNYVKNDDTYIEFLLQVIKQDIKKLSGTSTLFYDLVIKYIEDEVDSIIETQNTLIDPISNQIIKLNQDLSTDFKIRYFIKQQYSELLIRLENLFISLNLDLARETNLSIIENTILDNISLPNEVKQNYRNIILEFIFPTSKIMSIMKINKIITTSRNYGPINSIYTSTLYSIKSNILSLLTADSLCFNTFALQTDGLDILNYDSDAILDMIKKFVISAPIEIIKGLAETFDPNIRIANPLRNAAESLSGKNLPCLPFSLALLPVGLVPFGFGPPVLPPFGFTYLALDTAEFLLSPKQKALKLKIAKDKGVFDKLEDLSEQPENC